jgi:hypothetical protein
VLDKALHPVKTAHHIVISHATHAHTSVTSFSNPKAIKQ